MDLTFKARQFIPNEEFFQDFNKKEFGNSIKFEVGLLFKNTRNLDSIIHNFVFDTGAFISYAPDKILKNLKINPTFEGIVYGIIAKKECQVKTKVAKVKFIIIDDEDRESKELESWFAFHPFEAGPYLFGMKDLFENIIKVKEMNSKQLILKID